MIEIDLSTKQIAEIRYKLGQVNRKKLNKVISKAANETAKHMRRSVSNYVRKEYTVLLGASTKGMPIKKATISKPIATIRTQGNKIPLLKFSVSNKKRMQKGQVDKKGNVLYHKAKVRKDSKMKKIVTAFIAKNYLLIRPKGLLGKKSHEPNNWLGFGPSMPEMIGGKKVWKELSKDGNKVLKSKLDKSIRDVVEGYR